MKHSKVLVASSIAAVLALGACSSGGDAPADNKVTFMGWGTPQEVEIFTDLIGQFEEKYSDIEVEYINVPATDFNTKLQTMIASNSIPDVFYLTPENVMPWAQNGILADLTEFTASNELFEEENIWAKAIDMYRYDGTDPGVGAIYGLPKDIGPFALAYNKDLFEAAGIPAPDSEEPWTWTEFIENSKKLTSGEGADKIYGSAPYSLESAVWSNGADWLDESHTKVTVTDPAFVEALQWVADLGLEHGVVPSSEDEGSLGSFQRFIDGRIGMMGIGPWSQAQFWDEVDFQWDIMPWPVSENTGEEAVWYGGIGYGVAEKSGNKDAASKLAAFLAFNEDAQRTAMEKGQAIPNLIDMTHDEYMTMDKAPANKQQFLNIIESVGRRATQTYTYNSEWHTLFNSNLESVWLGETSAADYVASIEPEMQELLDKGIAEQAR